MKKTLEIVMLRDIYGPIYKRQDNLLMHYTGPNKQNVKDNQHLYLVSDEEIEKDDLVLHYKSPAKPLRVKTILSDGFELEDLASDTIFGVYDTDAKNWRKVVATTNHNIWMNSGKCKSGGYEYAVAKIPQSFIEQYIKAYNEGKPIQKVDVECEQTCCGLTSSQGEVIIYLPEEQKYSLDIIKKCHRELFISNSNGQYDPQELENFQKQIDDWFKNYSK